MRACVRWSSASLCGLLMVSLAACNMPTQSLPSDSSLASATSALSIPGQGDPESSGADSSEPEFETIDLSGELAACQPNYAFSVSALATLTVMDMTLTQTLDVPMMGLSAEGRLTEGNLSTIHSAVSGEEWPYQITGALDDCTLSGEGKVSISVTGNCENGVVHLIITENWGEGNGQITCPDSSEEPAPFTIPGLGRMVHEGQDGRGETFRLRTNIAEVEGGVYVGGDMISRPFAMGEGRHTWTLLGSE